MTTLNVNYKNEWEGNDAKHTTALNVIFQTQINLSTTNMQTSPTFFLWQFCRVVILVYMKYMILHLETFLILH